MGLKTVPREPWRGGQICGHQTNVGGWSEGPPEYCGEFKKLNSPACTVHDAELREDNYGMLPKFAEGNALGLADYRRTTMSYMFQLAWEPYEGATPIPATEEEIAAWQATAPPAPMEHSPRQPR